MNYFALSCLLTSIAAIIQGFYVISSNKKSNLNKSWFLVSLFSSMWSFSLWKIATAENYKTAWYFQHILDLSAIFIPVFFYRFTIYLLKIEKRHKKILKTIYIISLIIAVISFFPYFKKGMTSYSSDFQYWINPGLLYPIFPIYFSLLMIYSYFLQIKNEKRFSGKTKIQIRYVLIAGLIGFIGGSTNFFPQMINIYPFGNYFVILYVVIVAYAIIKHRLMGIRFAMSRVYIYVILGAVSYGLFHLIAFFVTKIWGSIYNPKAMLVGIPLAIIFVALFLPLIEKIRYSSDIFFFKGYNPKKILKDLIIKLNKIVELKDLYEMLSAEIENILNVKNISVLVMEKDRDNKSLCIAQNCSLNYKPIKESGFICKKAKEKKQIIVRDELGLSQTTLKKEMDKHSAKVVVPLLHKDKLRGLMILGEKKNNGGFSKEDLEFLEVFQPQISLILENILLYREVKNFNQTLKEKVDKQTKKLKEKNIHLRKLLIMRGEFLNIASHQLRTPVTVIKGMSDMLLNEKVPADKRRKFLKGISQKAHKLSTIIHDILSAAEMDTEAFSLDFKKTNIVELINEIVDAKMEEIKENNLKLVFKPPHSKIMVLTNERYLGQAILNLINNSIQYTPAKGKIKINIEDKEKEIILRISDTGIGIPSKDIPRLFDKFVRAKNATKVYTDGSGLGLFITKKIVEAHKNGKIYIEKTEINKGTTFAIHLPKA